MAVSEFTVPYKYKTNRSSPVSWIISHTLHHWLTFVLAMIGAIGNAALAYIPVIQYARVFVELTSGSPNLSNVLNSAVIVGLSQSLRGISQFIRNFGFELTAQSIETDVREEFYLSLLGKSMTFHALQSVGDLMARATNDIREINYLYSPGINMVFGSVNFLIIPLITGWRLHPQLILIPTLFIVLYFAFIVR